MHELSFCVVVFQLVSHISSGSGSAVNAIITMNIELVNLGEGKRIQVSDVFVTLKQK